MRHSPEWATWQRIIDRCENPNRSNYSYYGGRGITIAPEWRHDFTAFYDHVGPRPSPEHSIDRYPDPSGNYAPGNVRWATRKEQRANRKPGGRVSRYWSGKRHYAVAGAANRNAKLTREAVGLIRDMRSREGLTYKQIGSKFGVSAANVHRVVKHLTWRA